MIEKTRVGRWIGARVGLLVVAAALSVPTFARAQAPGIGAGEKEKAAGTATFTIPRLETIKHVARPGRLSQTEAMTSSYILETRPHPVRGDAYLVLTDQRDAAYLGPLERLAAHHAGTLLKVDDLGVLAEREGREALGKRLAAAQVRYLAVAPREESFRENVLLGLWGMLATLDADPELDALPGLLIAPDAARFAALIDRSIAHQPTPRPAFHPFVISQLGDASPNGSRSLQKLGVLRERFGKLGVETPGLVVRQFPGEQPRLEASDIFEARTRGPRVLLTDLPEAAARAIDQASLLVMFGHGTPGVTCGLRVEAFDHRTLADKVILCGSCFSAAPTRSDFPRMAVGPDGMEVVAQRKRFVMEALEGGAVAVYGHMRLNGGFPHLYPVLDSLLRGETVGEAYQQLINGLLTWTQLGPDELVLAQADAAPMPAVMRRNQLLYVFVGDPALRPLAPLTSDPAAAPTTAPAPTRASD